MGIAEGEQTLAAGAVAPMLVAQVTPTRVQLCSLASVLGQETGAAAADLAAAPSCVPLYT